MPVDGLFSFNGFIAAGLDYKPVVSSRQGIRSSASKLQCRLSQQQNRQPLKRISVNQPLRAIPLSSETVSQPLRAIPLTSHSINQPPRAIPLTSHSINQPRRAIPLSSQPVNQPSHATPLSSQNATQSSPRFVSLSVREDPVFCAYTEKLRANRLRQEQALALMPQPGPILTSDSMPVNTPSISVISSGAQSIISPHIPMPPITIDPSLQPIAAINTVTPMTPSYRTESMLPINIDEQIKEVELAIAAIPFPPSNNKVITMMIPAVVMLVAGVVLAPLTFGISLVLGFLGVGLAVFGGVLSIYSVVKHMKQKNEYYNQTQDYLLNQFSEGQGLDVAGIKGQIFYLNNSSKTLGFVKRKDGRFEVFKKAAGCYISMGDQEYMSMAMRLVKAEQAVYDYKKKSNNNTVRLPPVDTVERNQEIGSQVTLTQSQAFFGGKPVGMRSDSECQVIRARQERAESMSKANKLSYGRVDSDS